MRICTQTRWPPLTTTALSPCRTTHHGARSFSCCPPGLDRPCSASDDGAVRGFRRPPAGADFEQRGAAAHFSPLAACLSSLWVATVTSALLVGPAGAQTASIAPMKVLEGPARVVDGDTLYVEGQKIRLFALDAPEKSQMCLDASGREYACGEESLQALSHHIKDVPLRCAVRGMDQYNRAIATCTLETRNGVSEDIGAWLVNQGYAIAYRCVACCWPCCYKAMMHDVVKDAPLL
jgi:endonuclease YncB( thermonuclease family)